MRGLISRGLNRVGDDPTRSMEIFIGFIFMLDGLYVASPLYTPSSPASPLFELAADEPFRFSIGILYFLLGAFAFFFALFGNNLKTRRIAAMSLFLASLFSLLFRMSVFGFAPSAWVFSLMLTGVFVCDWLFINKCLLSKD